MKSVGAGAPDAPPPEAAAQGPAHALELALPPATLGGLLRGPALARLRTGTARAAAHTILWFDTPDGTLAAQGLALELHPARRGARQVLRRTLPAPTDPWPPGCLAPPLAEMGLAAPVPDAGAAGLADGTALVALAACEARRRVLALRFEGTALRLAVTEGKLRTVAAEQPVLRLVLEGPPGAPMSLLYRCAAALAAEAPLLPAAPLAEAARALARGEAARPLRRGAPVLAASMSAEAGFVHAVQHLAAVLIAQAPALGPAPAVEVVHQFRVALRRLRSVIAVWRDLVDGDAVRALDAGLKGLGRLAAPVRDRDVFMAGQLAEAEAALEAEGVATGPLAALRRVLAAERAAASGALSTHVGGAEFRALVFGLVAVTEARPWRAGAAAERLAGLDAPIADFGAAVLARRQRRLLRQAKQERQATAEAIGTDRVGLAEVPIPALHALRLSGKRLRYAAEVFAPCFEGGGAKRYLRRLAELQEALGHVNDGAVAGQLVRAPANAAARESAAHAWARGVVEGFAAARASFGRQQAEAAWARFRDADPFWA